MYRFNTFWKQESHVHPRANFSKSNVIRFIVFGVLR